MHPVGRPVGGKANQRIVLLGAAPHCAPVPTVLRREHLLLELGIIVAVWPPEVAPLADPHELLGRLLGTHSVVEVLRPQARQLVAPMNHGVELPVLGAYAKCHRVAHPGGVACAVFLPLARPIGVEPPDPGPVLELLAGILPRRADRALLFLTGVGRRADVHIDGAVRPEHETLGPVAAPGRQPTHDRIDRASRLHRSHRPRIAHDRIVGGVVEETAAQLHVVPRPAAEPHPLVRRPVPIRVTQHHHPTANRVPPGATRGHEHVPVLRHREVPCTTEPVGYHQGTEALGEREAGIVRCALEPLLCAGARCRHERQEYESCCHTDTPGSTSHDSGMDHRARMRAGKFVMIPATPKARSLRASSGSSTVHTWTGIPRLPAARMNSASTTVSRP